jgi:hypothetical protein
MRTLNLLPILALVPALSGCIFFETKSQRAMVRNPEFQAGYQDGCASANTRGTNYRGDKIRDAAAYQVSQPYRSGWGAGFQMCNNQLQRQANPNASDLPDQRPNP